MSSWTPPQGGHQQSGGHHQTHHHHTFTPGHFHGAHGGTYNPPQHFNHHQQQQAYRPGGFGRGGYSSGLPQQHGSAPYQPPHHAAPAHADPYQPRGRGGPHHHGSYGRGAAAPPVGLEPYTREEPKVEDIFKDHTAGIDFSKYEQIEVSIKPDDIPPADTFAEMDLPAGLAENVRRCNYTTPTPVQKYGIPPVLAGQDMMACAQTGSGKTAAFLLPAIAYMLKNPSAGGQGRCATPTALVMAPTRELSIQIYDESRKFTYRTNVRSVVVYGGADPRYQLNELARGCNLIVATPGRLWDFFVRGCVKFASIRFMVLDEADRMLDMGFEPQIRQIVQGPETDMAPRGTRQTLMYSATFPKDIRQLAWEFLNHSHYFLQVGRVGSTHENIKQEVRRVADNDKREELSAILTEHVEDLVLVFVEKKRDADYLERFLFNRRFTAASIHGDRAQREREMALSLFKTGRCGILVATDVASRGLDIPDVTLVINYDLPSNIDSYVHRIGRTGRAGKKGTAISFFNERNANVVDDLVQIMDEAHQEVPDWLRASTTRRPPPQARGRGNGRGFGGGFGRGGFNPRGGSFGAPRGGFGFNNRGGFRGGAGGFAAPGAQNGYATQAPAQAPNQGINFRRGGY